MNISKNSEFIQKARKIHGDKYDYSKVEYINSGTKICIICPKHGEFYMTPSKHLKGQNCPKCSGKFRYNTLTFIEKAKEIHGDKYDYSKVEYINGITKICIICPIHGEFYIRPRDHINSSQGCVKCGIEKVKHALNYSYTTFIDKAKTVHGDKYDYSKVNYINSLSKVCIICPEHGEFWQRPDTHIRGCGCFKCSKIKNGVLKRIVINDFIKCANNIHNNKYDYSKSEYINTEVKVCIICPEHGEFWQTPHAHLQGQGCPYCNESKLEKETEKYLKEFKISFIKQKKFDWLRYKNPLSLDFYLPEYNIAIECQGRQHFIPIDFFGGEKFLIETNYRDKLKYILCKKKGINIKYINYTDKIKEKLKLIIIKNEKRNK